KDRVANRAALKEALDRELQRLGLSLFPPDADLGQVAIERHFTRPIHEALLRGELQWDEHGIPQRQDYRPVETLADAVVADAESAGKTASILRHFESELDYEPIGSVGTLSAERALWRFGDRA